MLGSVQAENYEVSVCNVAVSSDNKDDIVTAVSPILEQLGWGTLSGSITYDPSTKTLTLENVTAEMTSDYPVIYFRDNSYNLVLKGTNTLST